MVTISWPSWKIKKLQYLHNRLTNLDEIWKGDACQPFGPWQPIKFCDLKYSRWRRGHLENSKNRNIFAMGGPVSRKFGMVMCPDPPDLLSI